MSARGELSDAGVPDDRIRLEWMLNLVYPGQTFDQPLPLPRADDTPIGADDVAACVEEFHRRNEAARLIEARSQEPMVRGVRLKAIGLVSAPVPSAGSGSGTLAPVGHRRVHTGDGWHDAPVFDGAALHTGPAIRGPALVQWPFTTLVLGPGQVSAARPDGDVLVEVGATSGTG